MRLWGVFTGLLLGVGELYAQQVSLRSGNVTPEQSWAQFCNPVSAPSDASPEIQVVLFITETARRNYQDSLYTCGLRIREYLGPQAWLCTVKSANRLSACSGLPGISGVHVMNAADKTDPVFREMAEQRTFHVRILGFDDEPPVISCKRWLQEGFDVHFSPDSFVQGVVDAAGMIKLASRSDVVFLEPAPEGPFNLNHGANWLHRTLILHQPGIRGLTGTDVVISIGDEARINHHIDYQNRVSRVTTANPSTSHAHQVAGTALGSGIGQEHLNGMAPGASGLSDQYYIPIVNLSSYKSLYGLNITNNSYAFGAGNTCSPLGTYGSNARQADKLYRQFPTITHIVASGNSGGLNCSPYPAGYATINEGYQSAKNAITVGSVTDQDAIAGSSSRGPVKDGRIKPDVVAKGQFVSSTVPNHSYTTGSGTSFATPGVSGVMALLYQRYRQLNSGQDPDATYLKAVLLNTARDLGNTGPDYTFGYGRVDAYRAVELLESGNVRSSSLSGSDSVSYTITVPSGTGELRVMLCWADTTPSSAASVALVNNLDLRVIDPGGTVYQPWILNTTPANVATAATRGTDNLNNVEQVTIDLPTSGTYTIRVKGTSVPLGPQKFWLVYEHRKRGVRITTPAPGEAFLTSGTPYIAYDGFGINSGTYTIDYSADSGVSWTNITTTASATASIFSGWATPSTAGNKYLIRITHNSLGLADTMDGVFTLLGKVVISGISSCGQQAVISWSAISGATDYEVSRLIGGKWVNIGYTTATTFRAGGLVSGNREWFSVRARIGKATGRRSDATTVVISNSSCSVADDVGVQALVSPRYGRELTSARLTASQTLTIRIKNYGNNAVTNFPIYYKINSSASVNQTYSGTINANDTIRFSFTTTANLSATGIYKIRFWTNMPGDIDRSNDTLTCYLRHAANAALSLPFRQTFEAASDTAALQEAYTLNGIESVDFYASQQDGRIRTWAGPGTARGKRGLILDKLYSGSTFNQNYAIITSNLSTYSSGARLLAGFDMYLNGETAHSGDSLWVRGADTLPWIPVMHLSASAYPRGTWISISQVNISAVLSSRGQNPGASTQFRFGQYDSRMQRTMFDSAGIMIDNFSLSNAPVDVQLLAITTPVTRCGQGTDSVKISIRNNGNSSVSQVPLAYRLDGGAIVRDTLKSTLTSGSSVNFTFKTAISVNDLNAHQITIWCQVPSDGLAGNDTVRNSSFRFLPRVTSLPFLDHFEGGQRFYAEGTNSSWEWGTPNSSHVVGAASGSKAWATSLRGEHSQLEYSYLYSPCFDLSSASSNVRLSFHATHQTFNTSGYFNGYTVEYTENGSNWFVLGTSGSTYNNYNVGAPYYFWNGTRNGYKVVGQSIPVSGMSNKSNVRFRVTFFSDYGTLMDGVTLDDWHIFDDATGVYNGSTTTQTVSGSGTGWVHFGSGNTRYLSIKDSGNSIGSSIGGVHQYGGSTRYYFGQYTMNRNWWLIPSGSGTGQYQVRLYYRESDADNLSAIDPVISDFRDFGVTRYTGPDEDSLFTNDSICQPCYTYYQPSRTVVPYFDGQYLEFSSNGLSEFWINGGTISRLVPLQESGLSLKGSRQQKAGWLQWKIHELQPFHHFEVYRCQGNTCRDLVASIPAAWGQQEYSLTDPAAGPDEVLYELRAFTGPGENHTSLRTKIPALPGELELKLFPNPSNGDVVLLTGASRGPADIRITGSTGQEVFSSKMLLQPFTSHGLQLKALPEGIYFMTVTLGNADFRYKLLIQRI